MMFEILIGIFTLLLCAYILWRQNHKFNAMLKLAGYDVDGAEVSSTGLVRNNAQSITVAPKTLNLAAARKTIPRPKSLPELLRRYSFGDEPRDIGIYENWNRSHIELGDLCDLVTEGLHYAYHNLETQDANLAIAIAEDFIARYETAMMARPMRNGALRGFPWGENWYQFSIVSTSMLAYYLLLPITAIMRPNAVRLINMIISSPRSSLGYARDESNMIYMTGPWLLAKHYGGDLQQALEHSDYKSALDFLNMKFQSTANANGLHRDYSFVAHTSVIAPAYFASMTSPLTLYFYKLDPRITVSPDKIYTNMRKIMFHDSLTIGPIGYAGRKDTLRTPISTLPPDHGIRVMPFARFIRMFTPNLQFSARATRMGMGYYEADRKVSNTAQYWLQYRNVHTSSTSEECVWPNFGFLQQAPLSVNDKGRRRLLDMPPTTATTQIYYPTRAKSFVMRYDPYGVLWQDYSVDRLGEVDIRECIIIEHGRRVIVRVRIVNRSTRDAYHYYGAYNGHPMPFEIPAQSRRSFQTVFDLNAETDTLDGVHSEMIDFDSVSDLPIKLANNIVIRDVGSKYAILYDRGEAKVCSPYELQRECNYLPIRVEKRDENGKTQVSHIIFKFNRDVNQYTI